MNSNQQQINFPTGEQLRDEGIKRAIDHADAEQPKWSEHAWWFLQTYMKTHKTFTTEEVRKASEGVIPEPPDARAWGGIIRKAVKEEMIELITYVPAEDPKAHRRPTAKWRRMSVIDVMGQNYCT